MSEQKRVTSEDLALFAMQLLSKDETAQVSAYLKESPSARRELAEIQGDLAIYAHTVDMQPPSAQARRRRRYFRGSAGPWLQGWRLRRETCITSAMHCAAR